MSFVILNTIIKRKFPTPDVWVLCQTCEYFLIILRHLTCAKTTRRVSLREPPCPDHVHNCHDAAGTEPSKRFATAMAAHWYTVKIISNRFNFYQNIEGQVCNLAINQVYQVWFNDKTDQNSNKEDIEAMQVKQTKVHTYHNLALAPKARQSDQSVIQKREKLRPKSKNRTKDAWRRQKSTVISLGNAVAS